MSEFVPNCPTGDFGHLSTDAELESSLIPVGSRVFPGFPTAYDYDVFL